MNLTRYSLAALAAGALVFSGGKAAAQGTITNTATGYFNSADGYTQGGSLTGLPTTAPASEQFQTTDPFNPGPNTGDNSYVDFIPGTTFGGGAGSGSGNNSVWFGGVYPEGPGVLNQAIYQNFTSAISNPTESVTFSIDFRLIESTNPFDDSWSFDLRNSTGVTTLVGFELNPVGGGLLDISGNGSVFGQLAYDGLYNLTVTLQNTGWSAALSTINIGTNGLGDVTSFVTNAPGAVSAGALVGGTALDYESNYISWLIDSGNINDFGDNYMIINQFNVTSDVIPEPGTWAVGALLLGGVAASIYRRRKLAAASLES
jgi:hypothetical protein